MSPWTKVLDGKNRDDTTPLLPDSDPPDSYREQDASASVAGSSSPVDEYPDPVKPGRDAQNSSFNGYPAISVEPPPVYAPGNFVTGHPVLPQATEPPAPGHSQLVTNERRIVQQPMKGNAVIVSCPQCGHVGPALVSRSRASSHTSHPGCCASWAAARCSCSRSAATTRKTGCTAAPIAAPCLGAKGPETGSNRVQLWLREWHNCHIACSMPEQCPLRSHCICSNRQADALLESLSQRPSCEILIVFWDTHNLLRRPCRTVLMWASATAEGNFGVVSIYVSLSKSLCRNKHKSKNRELLPKGTMLRGT